MHSLSSLQLKIKEQFYAALQAVIGAVDEHDVLIVVGDFR